MINYNGLFLSISRIESYFLDDIGNDKSGTGTAFALQYKNKFLFVTNRHMVDPRWVDCKKFNLSKLYIWCRIKEKDTLDYPPEKIEIDISKTKIITHSTADVAIILDPKFYGTIPPCTIPLVEDSLATNEFFNKYIEVADPCVFIGYPSKTKANPWWDTTLGLPIVRLANIASYPKKDFENKNINSSHAKLVTGLSFAGSSGSPILNLVPHFKTKDMIVKFPNEIEPKIIGLMAGHWWYDNKDFPEMMRHTGISYFVSSIAILDILNQL